MDVVRHPSDFKKEASLFANDAPHVVIEAVAVIRADERHPALRAEYDVEDQHYIAMCHSRAPLSRNYKSKDPNSLEEYQLQEPSRRDKGSQPRISILGVDGVDRGAE
jgi:hypothetical protein